MDARSKWPFGLRALLERLLSLARGAAPDRPREQLALPPATPDASTSDVGEGSSAPAAAAETTSAATGHRAAPAGMLRFGTPPSPSSVDEADDAELDTLRGELVRELDRMAQAQAGPR